jgi:hypothetical protein
MPEGKNMGGPMTGEPDFSRPEEHAQTRPVPMAEAQPPPRDDIPLAGGVPQPQPWAGTAPLTRPRSPVDFTRLRRGDVIAGILDPFGSSSWAAGAILALIAAITAAGGAVLIMRESKVQHAARPVFPGGPGA